MDKKVLSGSAIQLHRYRNACADLDVVEAGAAIGDDSCDTAKVLGAAERSHLNNFTGVIRIGPQQNYGIALILFIDRFIPEAGAIAHIQVQHAAFPACWLCI